MNPIPISGPALCLRQVDVRRRGRTVLRNVDLALQPGARLGILGANGCGKSTLLRTCAGLHAHTGDVRIGGHRATRPAAARTRGWMPDTPVYPTVSVQSLVRRIARLHGVAPPETSAFDLDPRARADRLSQGQARLLGFVLATLHAPTVLLLDEAFTALDRVHAERLEAIIRAFRGTLVMTAHHPDDLRGLTHELRHLQGGRLQEEAP